jgi:hypothetical protein
MSERNPRAGELGLSIIMLGVPLWLFLGWQAFVTCFVLGLIVTILINAWTEAAGK